MDMSTYQFEISGMTCDGCLKTVQTALEASYPGVRVTRFPPRATFPLGHKPTLAEVAAVLVAHPRYSVALLQEGIGLNAERIAEPVPDIESPFRTYYPLILIAVYISVVSFAGHDGRTVSGWMSHFMAGFFLVFSFFKMLDLRGFADAFASYDVVASRVPHYGLIYPFLELSLGLAYLFRIAPDSTNMATVLLMGLGSIGVARAVMSGAKIRCACLGTVLNLPMSTITLIENGLMISMAVMALVLPHTG